MNLKETRINILDLQNQYFQICEYQTNSFKECVQQCCKVGKKLKSLASSLFMEGLEQKSKERWILSVNKLLNCLCKDLEQIIYQTNLIGHIALCVNNKKWGLWSGNPQSKIQKQSQ
ncbi:hypothetical protein [Bacillus cereus]|uniref:hypothetical protein n=1 Tax=Bacillus cereus TaxID=1396 RepID=UPI0018CEDABD|nr:hypothetical protein [Bacillus cereus]MBG9617616.1 hypothetical protein [Bacillus cereus]